MKRLMPDSRLNVAEHALQQRFRKLRFFNSLVVGLLVLLAFVPLSLLPEKRSAPPVEIPLSVEPVPLAPTQAPLVPAGAWRLEAADRRFHGISALAIDGWAFLAVSDLGSVVRFDRPDAPRPTVRIEALRDGPGDPGWKVSRDAESLVRDPRGRGWWVGYEQHHSLWLYDPAFRAARIAIALPALGWAENRGAEALVDEGDALLVLAENGRDAVRVDSGGPRRLALETGESVADAARAPDGSAWLLLRRKGLEGISQSIAPLERRGEILAIGERWPLPKGPFDNFEGMAIEVGPSGGLRFWLVTDDGHRIFARTLLVALDLAGHDKRPADEAGRSKSPETGKP